MSLRDIDSKIEEHLFGHKVLGYTGVDWWHDGASVTGYEGESQEPVYVWECQCAKVAESIAQFPDDYYHSLRAFDHHVSCLRPVPHYTVSPVDIILVDRELKKQSLHISYTRELCKILQKEACLEIDMLWQLSSATPVMKCYAVLNALGVNYERP